MLFTKINALTFTSQSLAGSQMNWNMQGTGTVKVRTNGSQIDFDETIMLENGRICHDKKRWRFSDRHLYFERHRHDHYEPIFEFLYENEQFVPQKHYWCAPDAYSAQLAIDGLSFFLTIYIRSERKNECLRYTYRCQAD